LDITHYADLSKEQLDRIEKEANQAVLDALKISSKFVERNQAEKRYGFRLYQGGAVPGREIRVVNIDGLDVEACGGTHCKNTSEVGMIRILGARRIQDGVVRMEFAAGLAAVEQVQKMGHLIKETAQLVNSSVDTVPSAVQKLLADMKESRKEIDKLKKEVATGAGSDSSDTVSIGGVRIIKSIRHVELRDLTHMAKELISNSNTIAVLASGSHGLKMIIARSEDVDVDCSRILGDVFAKVGGSGGGKPDFAQGGGPHASKAEEAIELALSEIKKGIESRGKS
jgi:alanyl-tRNA synthetase